VRTYRLSAVNRRTRSSLRWELLERNYFRISCNFYLGLEHYDNRFSCAYQARRY